MDCYDIRFKASAERDLRRIDRQRISRIMQSIEKLSDNPFPSKARKIVETESTYRIRVGDYRVIYQVNPPAKTVIIEHIRHKREAYKNL